jgi:hypothetical protein
MIAEFDYPQGHLVAYQYSRITRSDADNGRFYLYFMNDTLIRKSPPEELKAGAKIAVKEYYANKREREIRMQEREEQQRIREEQNLRKKEYNSRKREHTSKKKERTSKEEKSTKKERTKKHRHSKKTRNQDSE